MRINRTYALAATAWLVLVVVGAVMVWAVISRAGQGVVTQPGPAIGEAAPITSPPASKRANRPKSPKPSPRHPSGSASASPGGQSTSGPSGPRSSSSTPSSGPPPPPASSAPGPAPGPGPGPSSSPNSPPPPSSPPPPQSTQDQGVRRTWQGSAGVVTVECNGATISLKGAQPNSGWSIDIEERGPEEVRIDFEGDERRTRVQSECVGGTPQFDVEHGDD